LDLDDIGRDLESLIFVADEPVEIGQLARALEIDLDVAEEALDRLIEEYSSRGIRIQKDAARVQFVTAPESAPAIRKLLGIEITSKLTMPSLETLAMIAYRQPVTRVEIEAIRGVQCDGPLRTLVARGLVQRVGRQETAGRPILYGTTFDFLRYFGIQNLDELPPISDQKLGQISDVAAALGKSER